MKTSIDAPLFAQVQAYLRDVLGIPAAGQRVWKGADALPYFLRDAFEFRELNFLAGKVLLAITRDAAHSPVGEIRSRLEKVRAVAGCPVVYVTHALAPYERQRLIQQRVPFIVPGNQLYLPDAGLDLREYFRRRRPPVDSQLSPSTQAMLIAVLLRPNGSGAWHPAELVARLGYTPMTQSRAVRELVSTGLVRASKRGRSQELEMAYSPRETWERARPLLRSPVQRTFWTMGHVAPDATTRLAGVSALARRTMLAEPRMPVRAVTRATWQTIGEEMVELPEPMPEADEWQLWAYSPALLSNEKTVDPLSLILSLEDNPDERVQSALDELKEQLPWLKGWKSSATGSRTIPTSTS